MNCACASIQTLKVAVDVPAKWFSLANACGSYWLARLGVSANCRHLPPSGAPSLLITCSAPRLPSGKYVMPTGCVPGAALSMSKYQGHGGGTSSMAGAWVATVSFFPTMACQLLGPALPRVLLNMVCVAAVAPVSVRPLGAEVASIVASTRLQPSPHLSTFGGA